MPMKDESFGFRPLANKAEPNAREFSNTYKYIKDIEKLNCKLYKAALLKYSCISMSKTLISFVFELPVHEVWDP